MLPRVIALIVAAAGLGFLAGVLAKNQFGSFSWMGRGSSEPCYCEDLDAQRCGQDDPTAAAAGQNTALFREQRLHGEVAALTAASRRLQALVDSHAAGDAATAATAAGKKKPCFRAAQPNLCYPVHLYPVVPRRRPVGGPFATMSGRGHRSLMLISRCWPCVREPASRVGLFAWRVPSCHSRCRRLPPAGDTAVRGRSCLVALALSATPLFLIHRDALP